MPFDAAELKTLVDLAFIARRDYKYAFGSDSFNKLLAFQQSIAVWDLTGLRANANKNTYVSMMSVTNDGKYPPNYELIDRFRAEISATFISVTPPSYAPVTPVPPDQPPANTDDITALKQRISDLEALVAAGGGGNKPLVIEGDVIFKGRVGIGGLVPDSRSTLQMVNETSIMFANNFDLSNPDASDVNYGTISMSGDGGVRTLQNGYFSVREFDAYDPDGKRWFKSSLMHPNKKRAQLNHGGDSRGDWSLSKKFAPGATFEDGTPIPEHEYTQDIVVRIDEKNKLAGFVLYRPGFKWMLGIDGKYGPATYWTPELYASQG